MLIEALKSFYNGDTRKYTVTIRDEKTGKAISVDGGTLTITFKTNKSLSDADAAINESFAGVEADLDSPTGTITAILTPAMTTIPAGKYYYDFQFTSAEGEVTTILPLEIHSDKVVVKEGISKGF